MTHRSAQTAEIRIPVGDVRLDGDLALPEGATGVVLFAHGSGSGRHSPRNRYVARILQEVGLGTLLLDLLTTQEEANVETQMSRVAVDRLLVLGQKIHEECAQPSSIQEASDMPVAWAVSSTAAAVGEQDNAVRLVRQGEVSLQPGRVGADPHLLIQGCVRC